MITTLRVAVAMGALALAGTSVGYVKGRVDGWAARETAQKVSDFAALTARIHDFEDQIQENAQDGVSLDQIVSAFKEEGQELSDEISELFICPTDPVRRGVLNASTDAANRALNRASGRTIDDPSGAPQ